MISQALILLLLHQLSVATNQLNYESKVQISETDGFKTAIYYSEWSFPDHSPSEIPLSHITNIYYAFFGIDTHNNNIKFPDKQFDVENNIAISVNTLKKDWEDLTFKNVSVNVNSASDNKLSWVIEYLKSVNSYMDSTKSSVSNDGLIGQLNEMRKLNPRLKVSMSIGGSNSMKQFRGVTKNKKQVRQLALNIAANAEQLGFDGVDIDWEFPNSEYDKEMLYYMVKSLNQSFSSFESSKIISLAIPLDLNTLKYYDFNKMDKYITQYNLMGYDISGKWSSISGFQSNLYEDKNNPTTLLSIDSAIDYLERYIDKSKIILGMPAYGRSFDTDKLYDGFSNCANLPDNVYDDLNDCVINYYNLPPKGYIEVEDTEIGASYAYNNQTGKKGLIVYDTPLISKLKARYAINRGLGGGLWWDSKGDTLLTNTSRSLVYNFIDELGGISKLSTEVSEYVFNDDIPKNIIKVDYNSTIFISKSVGRIQPDNVYTYTVLLVILFFCVY